MWQFPSTFLMGTPAAVKPPGWDDVSTFEGLSSVGEEKKIDSRSSAAVRLPMMANEGPPSALLGGPTASRESCRTASTELYVPVQSSKRKHACPGFGVKNSLQDDERQSFALEKVVDKSGERSSPLENGYKKGHRNKRKRNHAELAIEDVEAAIRRVISAAEAVVVSYLLVNTSTASSAPPSAQHRSISLEAALSLANGRHLCGLDQYDLSGAIPTTGCGDSGLVEEDFDDEMMQDAYADIGMVVDPPEAARQDPTDSIEARATEPGCNPESSAKACQGHESGGDNASVHGSTRKGCDHVMVDEGKQEGIKGVEIGEVVSAVDCEINGRDDPEKGTGFLKEMTEREALLSTASRALEEGGRSQQPVEGGTVTKCITVPGQTGESAEGNNESDETVAEAPEADDAAIEGAAAPNRGTVCPDALLQFGSVVRDIRNRDVRNRAGHEEEEDQAEDPVAVEVQVTDNEAARSLESPEVHAELSLLSNVMAFPGTKGSCQDACKSDASHDNAARSFYNPFVCRWFGGWSGNADFNRTTAAIAAAEGEIAVAAVKTVSSTSMHDIGSEDAVPEQNASRARQKRVPPSSGPETLSTCCCTLSVDDEAEVECLPPLNSNNEEDEASTSEDKAGGSGGGEGASQMSQIDPLCSFVPCSISPPAALSLPSCHGDDDRSRMLAATVEACARTAMNIIDSRKLVDCDHAGQQATRMPPDDTQNVSPRATNDAPVKRTSAVMRKFSSPTGHTLSLLLHAVDIAGKALPKEDGVLEGGSGGDGLERPSTPSPNFISRSSAALDVDCDGAVEHSADCDSPSTTAQQQDVTSGGGKSGGLLPKTKGPSGGGGVWMSADSESPPLHWPRGKKRRFTACRVIDSDSAGWLRDDDDGHQMAQKDFTGKEGHTALQSGPQKRSGSRPVLRNSTWRSNPRHDPRTLFSGHQFLLTGFDSQKKEELTKRIERHGGVFLANVPAFSPKQRFKRRGVDCGARNPPIVIAPQEMRTNKYLYGCAVGSPLLGASWIEASISALECIPYTQYQLKQTRGGGAQAGFGGGGVLRSSESSPLFVGFQFLFHGQQDFISQLSTLAKHAGGRVMRKLVLNGRERKQKQKLVGAVVVEGSSNLPLDLQRAASKLELHVVDGEWMVVSLLNGMVLPFPTDATPHGSAVLPSQQSSAAKTGQPLQTYKRRRALLQSRNLSLAVPDPGIELLVKKLRDRSVPEENNGSSCPSGSAKSIGKAMEEGEGHVNACWLGKGFTSPPEVLQLAERLRGPYSHSLAHKRLPKKFLYYEAFICNGVEYFLGDIVEVRRASAADGPLSVARIEGMWSEEGGSRRLPQTRGFQDGVRKKAFKNVVLKCRRFYRPSDTGFPMQQCGTTTAATEIYLSNNIDDTVSASDIVRRVRVRMETAGEVLNCNNWYDHHDPHHDDNNDGCRERAAASSICLKKGTITTTVTTAGSSAADYCCRFFYDHARESLHAIKLDV